MNLLEDMTYQRIKRGATQKHQEEERQGHTEILSQKNTLIIPVIAKSVF